MSLRLISRCRCRNRFTGLLPIRPTEPAQLCRSEWLLDVGLRRCAEKSTRLSFGDAGAPMICLPNGAPAAAGHASAARFSKEFFRIQRRHASHSCGCHSLAIDVVDEIACCEHAGDGGPRASRLSHNIPAVSELELICNKAGCRRVPDGDEHSAAIDFGFGSVNLVLDDSSRYAFRDLGVRGFRQSHDPKGDLPSDFRTAASAGFFRLSTDSCGGQE